MKCIGFQLCLVVIFSVGLAVENFCWATSIRTFDNSFEIERSANGKLEKIILKKNSESHFIEQDYMQNFLDELVRSQQEVQYHGAAGFIETEMESNDWPEKIKRDQEAVNRVLKNVSIEPALKNPKVKEALNLLVSGAENDEFNFRIIAVPYNQNYFYNNEAVLKLFVKASGVVTLVTGGSYGVSAGLFLVHSAFNMLLERRTYFQNYFLYYLEKYGPEKYGITKAEARLIKSSIYESRIKFWDIWEKNKARVDWEGYGHKKYLDQLIGADKRRKASTTDLTKWGNRIGYVFNEGESSGYKRIINLFNPRSILSKRTSLGYEYNWPNRLRLQRLLYFLSQVAVRLSPVPVVSDVYDHFVESLYIPQRQTEGGLYGYFCDTVSEQEAATVIQQSVNPFVIMEVGN